MMAMAMSQWRIFWPIVKSMRVDRRIHFNVPSLRFHYQIFLSAKIDHAVSRADMRRDGLAWLQILRPLRLGFHKELPFLCYGKEGCHFLFAGRWDMIRAQPAGVARCDQVPCHKILHLAELIQGFDGVVNEVLRAIVLANFIVHAQGQKELIQVSIIVGLQQTEPRAQQDQMF